MSGTTRLVQVAMRNADPVSPKVVHLPGGAALTARPDTMIGRSLYFFGRYEPDTCALLKSYCRPGSVVVDAGANVGVHALEMASTGATIHAFEPHPHTFSLLKENISLNPTLQVCPHECALGTQDGTVTLHDPPAENDGMATLNPLGDWPGISVAQTTLDGQLNSGHLSAVNLLKIDVEGHELAVLQGAAETIRRNRPVVVFEHVSWAWDAAGYRFAEADALFREWDYQPLQRIRHGRPHPLPLSGPVDENLVALP